MEWDALAAGLVARHAGTRASDERVVLAVRCPAGNHRVDVARRVVGEHAWIDITSTMGSQTRAASIPMLLQRGAAVPFGATCMIDGALALRHTLAEAAVSPAILDEVVVSLATRCAEAERRLRDAGR